MYMCCGVCAHARGKERGVGVKASESKYLVLMFVLMASYLNYGGLLDLFERLDSACWVSRWLIESEGRAGLKITDYSPRVVQDKTQPPRQV